MPSPRGAQSSLHGDGGPEGGVKRRPLRGQSFGQRPNTRSWGGRGPRRRPINSRAVSGSGAGRRHTEEGPRAGVRGRRGASRCAQQGPRHVPGANGRLLQRLALSRHAWPCRGSHLPPGTLRANSHVPRPGNLTRGGRTGVAGRAAAMSPSGQTCTWHCGTRQSRAQSPVLGLVRPGPGAAVTSVPSEESSVVATPGDRKR